MEDNLTGTQPKELEINKTCFVTFFENLEDDLNLEDVVKICVCTY
jgi:hypothetical protein